jgi:DNA-directed RNA polymerase specialized sigma24 family protein
VTPDEVRERWPDLTDAQAAAVLLYERGLGAQAISRVLGISKAAVRDRLDGAERRIRQHHDREAA